ncbi:hypothetical protein EUGRSUZ_H00585 [Eucalyptus grandis]|uniref:Uncharacterized protein n=2 Tax=Eucalyptus grandis TaxID=71139 RepID=A0ACC3JL60_EUCGR|nr:hypothetical protein EUGRSUZ_H00585 [Eucalyptus grandis]
MVLAIINSSGDTVDLELQNTATCRLSYAVSEGRASKPCFSSEDKNLNFTSIPPTQLMISSAPRMTPKQEERNTRRGEYGT